jgi:hypothetical protein
MLHYLLYLLYSFRAFVVFVFHRATSNMSKHPKPGGDKPHPSPNNGGGGEQKRSITGSVHVQGEIEVHLPPDVKQKNSAANDKQHARETIKLWIEGLSLFFLIVYAGLTALMYCANKKAADAAKSAADTAKSTLIASQGAYVTIGRKDGMVAEFVTSKDHPDENVPLIVYFQNTGHIPATVAWDTSDRKDGTLESFGIHRFTSGMGRAPLPPVTLHKSGEVYRVFGKVIAGDSVGRNELAYISQSDLEKLSKKIVGFYIDGFYSYCDQLGTWSTHQFTLNYHTDIPIDLRFELTSDIEISNPIIPKSYFPPCTPTVVMSETQQDANRNAK